MFARHFIDNLDFAYQGNELRGEVSVADLPRLQDLLTLKDGLIKYAVRGERSRDGKPMLAITVDGLCHLQCQRCLDGLEYPVKLNTQVLLVPESELETLDDEESELDSIAIDKHMDVLDLVEQEILLSLPFAPRHPEGECGMAAGELDRSRKNPFSVLAALKKQ